MKQQLDPFTPKGSMSVKAACIELIQSLPPKEGISYDVAVTEVAALTGNPIAQPALMGPMLAASESLLAQGVPGVVTFRMSGWQRMSPSDMIEHAGKRDKKARRQIVWRSNAAAAAPEEELTWEERQRRDRYIGVGLDVSALQARRAARKRPLAS